jgi:uncharacterized protein YjaZ
MLSEIFSMLTQGTNVIYHHVNRQSQVSIKSSMIIWMVSSVTLMNNDAMLYFIYDRFDE